MSTTTSTEYTATWISEDAVRLEGHASLVSRKMDDMVEISTVRFQNGPLMTMDLIVPSAQLDAIGWKNHDALRAGIIPSGYGIASHVVSVEAVCTPPHNHTDDTCGRRCPVRRAAAQAKQDAQASTRREAFVARFGADIDQVTMDTAIMKGKQVVAFDKLDDDRMLPIALDTYAHLLATSGH